MDAERATHCASCHTAIAPDAQVYTLRVDLFASAKPPAFDERDLLADHRAEWERLLAEMSAMAPKGVEEEKDKVFERYEFSLCSRCRETFHAQLKRLT
jgi:mono/diheme cytochrome c family protein